MGLWVVRAGRHGEGDDTALADSRAVIGWERLPDLGEIATRSDVERLLRERYPERTEGTIRKQAGEVWAFLRRIQESDLIVLPLKTRSAIAIGEVTGPYRYLANARPDLRHGRAVRWRRTDLPRDAFDQDLLHSFGARLTVFEVSRNKAEARVRQMLEGKRVPRSVSEGADKEAEESVDSGQLDVQEYATDQIRTLISCKYRGHELSHLIAGILQAQGFRTYVSPPGPDAGIDILAAGGPMGFDPPRIAVQVKSGDAPLDVTVLRELQGVMTRVGADQGLVVAWGGFKETLLREARPLYFQIRLWNAGDIVAALTENYDRLPEAMQAEIPMKQVWTLVNDV